MPKPKKILMVAMPSLHFFRWTEQLKDAGFEVYWFDITGSGQYIERIHWVHQHTHWKFRWDFPGRHYIKKHWPKVYGAIQKINECDVLKAFEAYLLKVQPNMVHSFALYVACAPIIKVMENHPDVPWVYSSWGSDLYYFQNLPAYLKDIKRVLARVNYLFADCKRDVTIAKKQGFMGTVLGVLPGGGGLPLKTLQPYKQPLEKRRIVLIKGYQGRSGRAINVLKAISQLKTSLAPYRILVFGAAGELMQFVDHSNLKNWTNLECFGTLPQHELLKLMGQSLVYIGNSNSDGMPNTLLETMCMGAFPIQSNPGGASEKVVEHGKNGLLIQDCENVEAIKSLLLQGLKDFGLMHRAYTINQKLSRRFEFNAIKQQVLSKYLSLVNQ